MTTRRIVLAGLLALSLAASAWLALRPQPAETVVAATLRRPAQAATDTPTATATRPIPLRGDWPEPSAAALAAWASAKPAEAAPAVVAAVPERPRPPAFPYQWIGSLDPGNDPHVLLSGPYRSFGARMGEVIDGRWRIDQIASRSLQLTWLATGERVDITSR